MHSLHRPYEILRNLSHAQYDERPQSYNPAPDGFLRSLPEQTGVLKKEQNTATLGLVWWLGRKQGTW